MSESLTWHDVIGNEKQQAYFQQTLQFVESQRQAGKVIYPPAKDVFNAFRFTEFGDVKVVILGQDPYHGLIRRMVCVSLCYRVSKHRPR